MASEDTVHLEFGKTAQAAQHLESVLLSLLLLFELHEQLEGPAQLADGQVDVRALVDALRVQLDSVENDKKMTLAPLWRRVDKVVALSGEAQLQLRGAVWARNYLFHHFYKHNLSEWRTDKGRDGMLGVLSVLRIFIDRGQLEISRVYSACCNAVGWDQELLLNRVIQDIDIELLMKEE